MFLCRKRNNLLFLRQVMVKSLRKIVFCCSVSLNTARIGLKDTLIYFFICFFISGLIIFTSVVSFKSLLSSGSVQYKEPSATLLLYFDNEENLKRIESYDSPWIIESCYAQIRVPQVYSNEASKVCTVVSIGKNCSGLVLGAPQEGMAIMKTYDMQKLNVHNGDSVTIDDHTYTVMHDPSLSFEDAGIIITSSEIRGKGLFVYMFRHKSSYSAENFRKEMMGLLDCPIYPYDMRTLEDGNVYYTSVAERSAVSAKNKESLLFVMAIINSLTCLYIVLNMENIVRYHVQKEHIEYTLCRLFASKQMATLQFFLEVLPISFIALLAAMLAARWYFTYTGMGATGISTWSSSFLLYAFPLQCGILFLLEFLALKKIRKKSIAVCLNIF